MDVKEFPNTQDPNISFSNPGRTSSIARIQEPLIPTAMLNWYQSMPIHCCTAHKVYSSVSAGCPWSQHYWAENSI